MGTLEPIVGRHRNARLATALCKLGLVLAVAALVGFGVAESRIDSLRRHLDRERRDLDAARESLTLVRQIHELEHHLPHGRLSYEQLVEQKLRWELELTRLLDAAPLRRVKISRECLENPLARGCS